MMTVESVELEEKLKLRGADGIDAVKHDQMKANVYNFTNNNFCPTYAY